MQQNNIDITHLTILESGFLKTTQIPYHIVMLTPAHLDRVKALHDSIINSLTGIEKTYMLPKSRDYFAAHLTGAHGNAVIGIISHGQLIAQAIINHPTAENPKTGMVDMPTVTQPEAISLLQGVAVTPFCRGRGLMNRMVAHWIDHAHAHGRTHVMAEIVTSNIPSWRGFLHGGLVLHSIGCDPSDGTLVYNACEKTDAALAKRLSPTFNQASALPCALEDIAQQKQLVAAGYVGVAYDRAGTNLIMAPAR